MTENNTNQNKRPFEIGAFSFVELTPNPVTGKMISPADLASAIRGVQEVAWLGFCGES